MLTTYDADDRQVDAWATTVARARRHASQPPAAGTPWTEPWRHLFHATATLYLTAHLPEHPSPRIVTARAQLHAELTELAGHLRTTGSPTPQRLLADEGLRAPVRRRLLGLPEDARGVPLNELEPGRRQGRWVLIDRAGLRTAADIGRVSTAYWVALTYPATVVREQEWGNVEVVRVPALVADLLHRDDSAAIDLAPARTTDTPAVADAALTLWSANRHRRQPLSCWPAALQAGRAIATSG